MKKFKFEIWKNGYPETNGKIYSIEKTNEIIGKILEKEIPYSFTVYQILPDGWKSPVYEYKTKREFWLKNN